MKNKLLKTAGLVAVSSMLTFSQAALAEINISGWINEGIIFYDDGENSDSVQATDNGTTLASRITIAGDTDLGSINAGFEVILEPRANATPLIFSNQSTFGDSNGHSIGVLGNSLNIKGIAGKLTVGLQSMPTDNIAVLEDPSLTLWSGISPVFRGNGFSIQNAGGQVRNPDSAAVGDTPVWGDFLNCFTASGLRGAGGIGIDCNGIYRQGVRYDFPAIGPIGVAVGWANDDVYDIAAKYKGNMGSIKTQFAIGYAINQGANGTDGKTGAANPTFFNESENFQFQLGLSHPQTGLFGTFAYQHEEADIVNQRAGGLIEGGGDLSDLATHNVLARSNVGGRDDAGDPILTNTIMACVDSAGDAAFCSAAAVNAATGSLSDESDAWWLKIGIKKKWFAAGDTSFAFDYGLYEDQYGFNEAVNGVTGSEVERIGFSIDQYFGSSLIIYVKWEQLELDVDQVGGLAAAGAGTDAATSGSSPTGNYDGDELSTFVIGGTYFF